MRVVVFFVALTLAAFAASASPRTDKVIENVRLPTGFKMEVYSDQVPGARSMALGQKGTLFVGTRARGGKVYALSGTPGAAATRAGNMAAAAAAGFVATTAAAATSEPRGAASWQVTPSDVDCCSAASSWRS